MSTPGNSSLLLPQIIKHNAHADPSGVFARIPLGETYSSGYKDVTKFQFYEAINHTASLMKEVFGYGVKFETLAYIGPGDIRYSIVVVAGMVAGYKVFLPSPRNSIEAQVSLLNQLKCRKMVITDPQVPCVPAILDQLPLRTMTLPALRILLEVEDAGEHVFEKTLEEAGSDPAFVLHTSGSTGIPKPLIFSHEFISRVIQASSLSPPDGYVDINRYFVTGRFFMTLPSFHVAGLAFSLIIPAYLRSIPVYALPGPPPTTESFISAIQNTNVDWAIVPPVVIDELGKTPNLLDTVASRIKYMFFTGGSVPKSSGDIVAQRLPMWQVLGSSECGSLPLVHPETDYTNSEDWIYLQLNPTLKSEMRHRIDDLHELVILRNEDTEHLQPVFAHFPHTTEYETRDLFKPHPLKDRFWAYHSRLDDVIVFLNGEKTNPVSFEEEVISQPEVRAALMIGAQRLEAALLIELATNADLSEDEKTAVIERIWPHVEKANIATPAHARISKSKILLVDPKKPMLRAGKGTVQRNATLTLYADEIENLYQRQETFEIQHMTRSGGNNTNTSSQVRSLVAGILGIDDLNFFQLGMDSLSAMRIQRALKSQFPEREISLNTIYAQSSIRSLSKYLETTPTSYEENVVNKDQFQEELSQTLKYFKDEIDMIPPITPSETLYEHNRNIKVLLTGSTGALGSYILDRLLSMPEVEIIYCFNRTFDAKDRQLKNHKARSLNTDFPYERVIFLTGDLANVNLGLSHGLYQQLLLKVTHVLHNAWPVNFNLPLSEFRSSLSGIVSLIRLSALSKWNSSIQFLSSISSVSSYVGGNVPETVINDLSAPAKMGYGQSKYIAELLLDYASSRYGVSASCIRIGQIAGAARTAIGWNRQEWLPSLVISSAFIGAIPETLGDAPGDGQEMVDWVPIDQLADVVMDLLFSEWSPRNGTGEESGMSVFHVVHPSPVSWGSLLVPTKKTLEAVSAHSEPIRLVPYKEWVSILKSKSSEAGSEESNAAALLRQNPASKLLEFYEALDDQGGSGLRTRLSMEKTLRCSPALQALGPLEEDWFTGWVSEWFS